MSKQMKTIDLRKLATNFTNEKSKEERYWQRNDAKFRAVHQRCTTYDEFRQIVEAAHLRPLERNETLTLERRPISWNQPGGKEDSSEIIHSSLESTNHHHHHSITYSNPKSKNEFLQQWGRIETNQMKLNYLHQINNIENLFLIDIPTNFLYELCLLYEPTSSVNDAELIVNILCYLIKSKRFELIKSFLTKQDRLELDRLFSRLCLFVHLRFTIFLLRNIYL